MEGSKNTLVPFTRPDSLLKTSFALRDPRYLAVVELVVKWDARGNLEAGNLVCLDVLDVHDD